MAASCKRWLPFLPVALLIVLAYSNSLSGELYYDNRAAILEDPRIRDARRVGEIFATPYWYGKQNTLYRPITTLSYLVNHAVLGAGAAPLPYHATNLLLHVINAALVFALARRLLQQPSSAVLAAALFGVHPVATEAVTNVVGRADQLATLFVLLGLSWHCRWSASPRRRLLAQLPFALGLLAKESGSVLPAICVLLDFLRARDTPLGTWLKRELRTLVPYAVTLALYLTIRFLAVSGHEAAELDYRDNPLVLWHGIERFATVVKVFGLQLSRWFVPFTLCGDYSFDQIAPVTTPLDPLFVTGSIGLLLILALAVVCMRPAPVVSFGIGFWLIALLPVGNLLFLIGTILGERLLYMPLVGIVLMLAALAERWLPRRAVLIVTIVLALLGAARTYARNDDWRTEYGFWQATFATSPRSVRARTMFAEKHADRFMATVPGALDQSLRVLEDGLAITPREPMLLASLSWYSLIKVADLTSARRFADAERLLLRVRGWVETALSIDAERVTQQQRVLAAGRVARNGHLETYRAHGALVARECLLAEAMGRPIDAVRLVQAETSLRRAVLTNPLRTDVIVELMQNLLAQHRPADAAVAGLWPLLMTSGQERATEGILRQAYRLAGIDPATALIGDARSRLLPRVIGAPAPAADLLARSTRVLVRMARALGAEAQAHREVEQAETRGLARAAIEPALRDQFGIDDARFWETLGR